MGTPGTVARPGETCHRPSCGLPITRCPNKHQMGSCWYVLCRGFVHAGPGTHACADKDGDAQRGPGSGAGA